MAAPDQNNMLYMDVSSGGRVSIEMRPDLAPAHTERITTLSAEGFYDGLVFHRVVNGFVAQTGNPTGTGTGGSDYPDLPAEFTKEVSFERGAIGMARTADPDSANSQFFVCLDDCSFLDGSYTLWGFVREGMEYIDALAPGEPPPSPDRIEKMRPA